MVSVGFIIQNETMDDAQVAHYYADVSRLMLFTGSLCEYRLA